VVAAPSFNPAPAEPPPVFEVPKFEASAFEMPTEMPLAAPKFEPLTEAKPEPEAPQISLQDSHKAVFDEPIFKAEPFKAEQADSLFAEPAPIDAPLEEGFAPKASAFSAEAPEQDAFASSGLGEDAFADHFEMPQDFADAMAQSVPAGDNFLSAARRSARHWPSTRSCSRRA